MTSKDAATDVTLATLSQAKKKLLELLLESESKQNQQIRPWPRDPRAPDARLPVSLGQQRLWFIDQLEGGGAAYNSGVVLRLRGALVTRALQTALDALVKRHETLRTVFVEVDGEPWQHISPDSGFELVIKDLAHVAASQRDRAIRQEKIEAAQQRFDLRTGPLIRGRLVHADDHVLIITTHHIVSDGWSVGVLIRELAELYNACRAECDPKLPPLPLQYADYAQWQRQWLRGKLLERQLQYWQKLLNEAPPELELPKDRPRPACQGYRGKTVDVLLDSRLAAGVRALARRHGMTLFMVLYAAWTILLSRLSGQSDVVIGTPVANRRRPELEGLIGLFVNTLALRIEASGELPLSTFLKNAKAATLAAFEHQDVPFEKVVEALRPKRSMSRHPIFQTMFVLQNTPRYDLSWSDLVVTVEQSALETSKFDLLLSLDDSGDEISGVVNYDLDLFDEKTVQRWAACFTVLLDAMVRSEDRRIDELPILPVEERKEIEGFNATATAYPKDRLIHELVAEQVARTPSAEAVRHEGRSLTYAQLDASAIRVALELAAQGVGPDRLVGICAERSMEMVIGVLAILKAGGAYLPLDPNYPAERLQYMLEDAAPVMVLTQAHLKSVLPEISAPVLTIEGLLDATSEAGAPSPLGYEQSPNSLVYVIYTSGSTGRPKGTAMPHGAMVNLIEWHRERLPLRQGQRVLQFAALSFDVAFQEIFSTLCTGGALVLLDEHVRRDAQALMQLLEAQSIERLFMPPLMLQSLAECFKAQGRAPGRLKEVITAGEQLRISPEIIELFRHLPGCQLHNHYGPTETHVVTALTLTGDPASWPALPSIGRPIANTQIYLLDRHRTPVPVGVSAEIYIAGANVARGYLHRAQLTEERFVRDPFSADAQARMYRTGDVGRWRADGTIEYLGRNDDQVKIRGYRIELGEVERQLARHAAVKEAAVIAREDVPGEKRLAAYVTLRAGEAPSVEELRAHLKSSLPDYMVPSAFVTLERLPLTPSGKLDRRSLPPPQSQAYASERYEAPQGEVEQTLAHIWQDLLQIERVGRQDDFFELGGHSLLVLKALSKVNAAFGASLSVTDLYMSPTIAELATRIDAGVAQDKIVDVSQEAALDDRLEALVFTPRAEPEAILFTGATGFIGRFLLTQLLQDTSATIYCLIRASSQKEAAARLRQVLSKWDLWRSDSAHRIVAVAGDLSSTRLGIDEITYQLLAQRIDTIYHCGTSMNHLETYAMAKPANVGSVRELLTLATTHRSKLINHISSLAVFSARTPGTAEALSETTSVASQVHSFAHGYASSKWVAENLLLRARERGIACNIFRLGLAWADSKQGRYDELQREYRTLKSCLLCGYGIQNYRPDPLLPVDVVASAITHLAAGHPEGGGIFHVAGTSSVAQGLFERCNLAAHTSLTLLPYYDWIQQIKRLHDQGKSLPAVPLIEYAFSMSEDAFYTYQRQLDAQRPRIDCTLSHREIEAAGLLVHEFNDRLIRLAVQSMYSKDPELRERVAWARASL